MTQPTLLLPLIGKVRVEFYGTLTVAWYSTKDSFSRCVMNDAA